LKDKEAYQKPKIESETMEMGVYGKYQEEPIPFLQPFFGLCGCAAGSAVKE